MEPLHDDVDWISLYDKSKFREIEICLDSGLLATDACKADVRVDEKGEFTRVEKVSVYREDMIKDKCTKHVEVEYCTTGGGVATEYCKHFAEVATQVPVPQTTDPVPPVVTEEIKIEKKGLLKVTQMELDELIKAKKFGLYEQFLLDDYVYLTKKNGTDEEFKGIDGKLDQSKTEEKEPYKICQLHTKEAWETYQQQMQPPPEQTVPDTTDPNAPETTDPNAPETTDPNAPGTTNPNVPDATQPSTPDPNTPVIPGSAGTQTQ